MPAHGARVGVRGGEGPRRGRAHVLEARVVQVRHVHRDAAQLQLAHAGAAEAGEPVGRLVAAAERVAPVPRERDHAHARLGERVEAPFGGRVVLQEGCALHREEPRRLARREGRVHVGHGASPRELVAAALQLALPYAPHALEQRPSRIAARLVGDERREALAPGVPSRALERDVRVVVGERGHARRRDARVVRGEPARHRRVAMERQPIERVAVQVEHPQASLGRLARRRLGQHALTQQRRLLGRRVLQRHEQPHGRPPLTRRARSRPAPLPAEPPAHSGRPRCSPRNTPSALLPARTRSRTSSPHPSAPSRRSPARKPP